MLELVDVTKRDQRDRCLQKVAIIQFPVFYVTFLKTRPTSSQQTNSTVVVSKTLLLSKKTPNIIHSVCTNGKCRDNPLLKCYQNVI